MKTIFLAAAILVTAPCVAQLKIPGRKAAEKKVERKVEQTVDAVLNGSNEKKESQSASDSDDSREKRQQSRDAGLTTLEYIKQLIKEPFLLKRGELRIGGDTTESEPAVNNALAASDAVIKEHEDKVEEFLATKPSATFTKVGRNTAEIKGKSVYDAIAKTDEVYKTERSISNVYYLQQLYLLQAYLAGAVKIYPDIPSLKEHHAAVAAAINRIGSRQTYIAKLKANYAEWAKNLRMIPAVMNDPSIERLIKADFPKSFTNEKMTVTKVNIVTPWIIEKNGIDIPLHKELQVNLAVKKADGTCGLASAYVRQVYEGGGKYGGAYMNMPSAVTTIPCENVK
ncbi:MAG: hypothetical protein QM791_17365 [Ferruginibacter sp.]